jgi:hypothetical protein
MDDEADTHGHCAEIRQLVDDYAVAMDRADLEAFPRLFVPDGSLIVRGPDSPTPLAVFTGPGPDGVAVIAQLMSELYRATLHHITTHAATVEGTRASGTTYCLAYHMVSGDRGGALETLGVRYVDAFTLTSEGWRFGTRDATRLWSQITPTPHEPLLIDRAAARQRAAGA